MFFRRQAAEEKELERQAASRLLHVASAINGFSAPSPFVFPEKNKDSRTWNINHTPEVLWHSNIGLGKEQTYHQRDVLFICVLRRPEVNIHRDIWRLLSWSFITKRLWQRVWKKDFLNFFYSEVPFKWWNRGLCTAHSIHCCTHWVYPETIQLCLTFWPDKGVFSLQVASCTNSFCNVWRHCNEIRCGI